MHGMSKSRRRHCGTSSEWLLNEGGSHEDLCLGIGRGMQVAECHVTLSLSLPDYPTQYGDCGICAVDE